MSQTDSASPILPQQPQMHDCWNSIGVRGDHTCPELQRHLHCHNCPVFAAAAGELLDGSLPDGYVADWTRHFAMAADEEHAETRSALIFRVGDEWLALGTALFEEIAEQRAIHSLPGRRHGSVLGLVNIRGELLVCVSLARLLHLQPAAAVAAQPRQTVASRLLVLRHQSGRTVFPADEVYGVHRFHTRELKEPPAIVAHAEHRYTQALLSWNGHSVGLLDDELLCHAFNRSLSSTAIT